MNDTTKGRAKKEAKLPARPVTAKQKISLVLSTIVLICLVSFIVQNWNSVLIEFLWMSGKIRIVYIILLSALAGGLITLTIERRFKKKR